MAPDIAVGVIQKTICRLERIGDQGLVFEIALQLRCHIVQHCFIKRGGHFFLNPCVIDFLQAGLHEVIVFDFHLSVLAGAPKFDYR